MSQCLAIIVLQWDTNPPSLLMHGTMGTVNSGRRGDGDCISDSSLMQLNKLSNSCSIVGHKLEPWFRQMSNNDYGRGKASRRNCKWCISLSELETTAVCSSGLVMSPAFSGCTHKQRHTNAFDYLHECSLLPGTTYSGFHWSHQLLS